MAFRVFALPAWICLASALHASPITFVHTGIGSGSIGELAFQNAAFTFSGIADTGDRQNCLFSTPGTCFFTDHRSATVAIDGLGTFAFASPTRTFVARESGTVGFARGGGEGNDLYDGPKAESAKTWDMLSSIGPVHGLADLLQWEHPLVHTERGVLRFDGAGNIPVMFRAIVPSQGDTDADGDVDITDLNNVRNNFGGNGLGDTDDDEDIDIVDLNNVRNNFGAGEPSPVPEPSSYAVATISLIGIVGVIRRQKRR